MPTYITLLRYTEQGRSHMKESPARSDRARKAFAAAGGEMKAFYLTMGQYDAVSIIEAPSDEACVSALMSIATEGAVQTETLRAFTEDEYQQIVASLP